MTARASVVAPAAPRETWARWSDIPAWPRWNPRCLSARVQGALAAGTSIELQLRTARGRSFWTRPVLTAVEPEAELSWQARALGLRAHTTSTLSAEAGGTRVTVATDVRGPMSFSYRLALTERAEAELYEEVLHALARSFR